MLEKCPFRVFILGLLIRGVMMISEPASNLLNKGVAIPLWKRRSILPQCMLIISLTKIFLLFQG